MKVFGLSCNTGNNMAPQVVAAIKQGKSVLEVHMCGIIGLLQGEGHIARHQLIQMSDKLAHRGPDDAGIWLNDSATVGLAHRRLSIIDLSAAGHQPMSDEKGCLWIVFNGEIYNFLQLRRELEGLGWIFQSQTDTEVILYAYQQWGEHCVAHFNGMFGFAIWDTSARELFMARDRIGKKPLYYCHNGRSFAFASECKALLSVLNPFTLDPQAVNAYFAFGYVPGDMSIFSGLQKLLPGYSLTFELETGRIRTSPYWVPPLETAADRTSPDETTLLDELQRLLEDSVRLRMISDVPLGILLSGGVDSSLITAMAARVAHGSVKTFTIGFPGAGLYDETPHASLVAKTLRD